MSGNKVVHLAGKALDRRRHVCAFFNSKDEEYRVLLPFVKEGFEMGDKGFHIVKDEHRPEHRRLLAEAGIGVADAEQKGQLEIRGGKMELRRKRIALAGVISAAQEASRPLIEACGHKLTINVPPEPIHLDADPTRLAQVFLNLLNNSAKYTPHGGHIWLTVERQDGEAVVRVRDSGVGIAAEMLPRIFELFVQVEGSLERSHGGLGIGLSLVRRLVEMHGGAVEAHSEGLGRGSEFLVRLPLTVQPTAEQPSQSGNRENVATVPKQRILIVDDNRDSAISLGMMLSLMGNEIRTAHDGLEGLEAAEAFQPDVMVLDIGLPKLNGYEVCRRIRKQPWGKRMVVVALTGWGQEEDMRRSNEAGFNHHMVKPVDPAALEKLLAGLESSA
jgi:CheY-like chemotaxis protein/two-component sensor histidine kinase